ncbi:MAG: mitochondrial fission ELM1 family protein [Hyphomonadaceae bacterium]|nr:mitochondrial fission ELM1 family protein [Hyphomonadaceae bacterium]
MSGAPIPAALQVWCVTDGRAGIENQALGLAEAIGRRTSAQITVKRVQLRTPWRWAPPGFTPASRQALSMSSDAIEPPWPDIWIGCGRASVPLSMGVRGWSRGRTLVVQLQDPRVNPREFDIVAPPLHDELEGRNVIPIVGACHRVTQERIVEEGKALGIRLLNEPGPRLAVLIGGKSKRQDISGRRARVISETLAMLKNASGGSLLATLSRRTGQAARTQFAARLAPHCALYYDPASGEGANPYFALLAAADAIFVTADSVNMATEAAATGKPIHILPVDGYAGKLEAFHRSLRERGCARPFKLPLAFWSYPPLLETDRVAQAALAAWAQR